MAVTPQQIAAGAALELPRFFNDTLDALGQGEGAYIRDGAPESVTSRVGQAVARGYCRLYGASPASVQGDASTRVEKACRPYLDSLEPAEPLGIELPFRGGQCPEKYNIFISGTSLNANGNPQGQWQLRYTAIGPVGGLQVEQLEEPLRFNIRQSLGSARVFSDNCGPNPQPSPGVYLINTSPVTGRYDGSSVSITPCGADNCGNPEPEVRQPGPIGNPLPPPFRFNPVPGIDVDVDVDIGPDGEVTFDIGTGPITVDLFPDGGGGGGGGGGNPPTPGDPGGSQDTGGGGAGQGGESGGDAPPGKVLTGVRIDILEAPPSRSRFTEEVDRGVAYVYMGEPSEGLGLEPTGALVRNGQFFFAQKDYLTRWAVRAKPGYNLRTTPYYKDAPE